MGPKNCSREREVEEPTKDVARYSLHEHIDGLEDKRDFNKCL